MSSWWQKIKQHPVMTAVIIVAGVLVTALIIVIVLGYWFNWSWVGVNGGESKITVTSISKGTSTAKELQPAKTLWDWLGLLAVLAIPVVVGLGAAWFTVRQEKVSDRENTDNQRAATLQAYIDKMSELLIKEHLGCELSSTKGELTSTEEEVRKIARVQTLTTLEQLDGKRKRIVLQFLHESGLINKDQCIIPLYHSFKGGQSKGCRAEGYYSEKSRSKRSLLL